ncbi:hypothetical protein [Paenibacillus sp. MMO-177]|uniref:hypothetical protein n=1 Tax=Paenibacillus sp. MMO-177 TaxID=3081289 RepID=UPI003016FEE2
MFQKIKFNSSHLLLFFGVAVFIVNTITRMSISQFIGFGPGKVIPYGDSINFIAIGCVLGIILLNFMKRPNILIILFLPLYSLCVLYSNINNKAGVAVFLTSVLPAFLLLCVKYNNLDITTVFKSFLKIYNLIIIVIFSLGIIDFFLHGIINEFIANHMSTESWATMIRTENKVYGFRMITVLGAPLMNAFYVLVFLILNKIYEHRFGIRLLNKYFLYGFSMVTIALTGSRSALLIALVYIAFAELFGRKKIIELIVIVITLLLIFNSSLFKETIYSRFELGFNNENDARYTLFENLKSNKYGEFGVLTGGGYNYSRTLTASSSNSAVNFEYPVLMFLFDNGIIATSIYYLITVFIPLIILLRLRNINYLVGYLLIIVYLNLSNAIAQFYDFNMALAFLQIVLIYLARSQRSEENIKERPLIERSVTI